MAQISNLNLNVLESPSGRTARAVFDLRFTRREIEENYEYQIRAYVMDRADGWDEHSIHPNGYWMLTQYSADGAKDERVFWFDRRIVHPQSLSLQNGSIRLTMERAIDDIDGFDYRSGDSYVVAVVTPEIHNAVSMSDEVTVTRQQA